MGTYSAKINITQVKASIISAIRAIKKQMSNDMSACVEACAECAAACEYCLSQCFTVGAAMPKMADCMKLCLECTSMCRNTASLMAMGSADMMAICDLCAKTSTACAAACAKFPDMPSCVECVDACTECADQCANMMIKMKSMSKMPGVVYL